MKFFRSIRQIYSMTRDYGSSRSISFDDFQNIADGNCIKFEVKLKVGDKYEPRSLEIRRRSCETGKQEWALYVVKYADYTSYDYFSLTENLITQLFDDSTSKCTFVFVENILRFKMKSLSDKWRLVEFIRANIEIKAHFCQGILENSPNQGMNSLPIHIFFHHTSLVLISQKPENSPKLIAHRSIFHFEMLFIKHKKTFIYL